MRATLFRLALVATAATVTLTAQQPAAPGPLHEPGHPQRPDRADGANWLTFGGNYANHRFSLLMQITPENVTKLQPQWTGPTRSATSRRRRW